MGLTTTKELRWDAGGAPTVTQDGTRIQYYGNAH